MSKCYLVLDEMPSTCFECPFRYKSEEMPLGNFTYQALFRCRFEPEDIYNADEEEEFDPYLTDIMNTKPDWCPLVEFEED